jgi:cytoskeleton-associated protein 5
MEQFDEVLLVAKGAYEIPEGEEQGDLEAEVTGPLASRIVSKAWKYRASAYAELGELFRANSLDVAQEYIESFPKYTNDSNAAAQEAAITALIAAVGAAPQAIRPMHAELTRSLIEKGLTSSKITVKNGATEALIVLYASSFRDAGDIVGSLTAALGNKNAKVQAAAASVCIFFLQNFGVRYFQLQPFLPQFEKLATSTNAGVRSEVMNFFKEAFRWVRDAILPTVNKLKKIQADELIKAFAEIIDTPTPLKELEPESLEESKGSSRPKKIDAYDLAEAKNIFKKYNEAWCDALLAKDKWTDKKADLEELIREADTPKIVNQSSKSIVGMCKRLLNDSNMQVVIHTIKVIVVLAKGQRKYFEPFAKSLIPLMLQKFKDKKTLVLTEVQTALEALLFSTTLAAVQEHILAALDDSNPLVKTMTCQWLSKTLAELEQAEVIEVADGIGAVVKRLMSDGNVGVRTEASKLLAVIQEKGGDSLANLFRDVDSNKLHRLKETLAKTAKEPPPEAKTQPRLSSPAREEVKKSEPKPRAGAKKLTGRGDTSTPAAPQASVEPPQNEAEDELVGLLSPEMMAGLNHAAWKEKLTGLTEFNVWLDEQEEFTRAHPAMIAAFIRKRMKDWKESNFNLVKLAFEIIGKLAKTPGFTQQASGHVLNTAALDKLTDGKVMGSLTDCVLAMCETISPKVVVGKMLQAVEGSNKPKVVGEACNLLRKIIDEFGLHSMDLKAVLDFAKLQVGNTSPIVKGPAQALLVAMYSFIGDALVPMLNDIKEATMKVLQEEFSRTPRNDKHDFRSVHGEESKGPGSALDSLPRAKIGKQASAIVEELNSPDWKVRKTGLDNFSSLLDASSMRISAEGIGEVVGALSERISDCNKSLVRLSLAVVGKLGAALGSEAPAMKKKVLSAVIQSLADKQSLVRQDGLASLDRWKENLKLEDILPFVAEAMTQDAPELLVSLCGFLAKQASELNLIGLQDIAVGIQFCLNHKALEIRNAADKLVAALREAGCEEVDSFVSTKAKAPTPSAKSPAKKSQLDLVKSPEVSERKLGKAGSLARLTQSVVNISGDEERKSRTSSANRSKLNSSHDTPTKATIRSKLPLGRPPSSSQTKKPGEPETFRSSGSKEKRLERGKL